MDSTHGNTPDHDPLATIRAWISEAREAGVPLPDSTTLSTATLDGEVSARTIQVKEVDDLGVVFSTQGPTRKTRDLDANPRCALTRTWPELHRQVRLACDVEELPDEQRRAVFAERPTAHQATTVTSPQGEEIEGLDALRARTEALLEQPGPIACPDTFRAYRAVPHTIELWTQARDRMHDRVEYRRDGDGWSVRRLAP